MKVKLTPTFIGTMLLVMIISVGSFYRIGEWLGWWGVVDVYDQVQTFIINWVIVITFAILGGILFGMFVGFRLLSNQGFTPFEESMLKMYVKVDDIQERIIRIEKELGIPDSDGTISSENASLRESLRTPDSSQSSESPQNKI